MTSAEPRLPVPEDDALDAAASAEADGVATLEEAALVAAAPDGGARVAAQRAVADVVGSPVGAQDPQAAGAGLAAALAAFDGGAAADAEAHPEAATAAVAAAATGGASPSGATVTGHAPRVKQARGLSRLAAVAATLVLVVGLGALAVGILTSGGQDDATTSTAAAPAATGPAGPTSLAAGAPPTNVSEAAAAAPPTDAAARATGATGPAPAATAAPTTQAPPPERPPPVVDGGDIGRQSDVEAVAQRTAATLNGVADPAVAAPGSAPPRDVQACIATGAATANETVGPLRYRAVGTFEGQPAVFLAFARGSGQPPNLLLILARSGCAVLASTHF